MDLKYKNMKEVLLSIVLGCFIGLSVIIPGISGSTIAIVMKIYDKLMYSFSNIFKKFKSCFIFLIPIGIGAVVGLGVGLVIVKLLLDRFPFPTICFFVGLMAGTYPIVHSEIKKEKITPKRGGLFALGLLVPILISVAAIFVSESRSLEDLELYNYIIFLGIGVLVSLTQLVPGLSATALLMMFGYYSNLMDSISFDMIKDFDLLLVFIMLGLGFLIGVVLFSKGIEKALSNYRKTFFFLICGLSIGSMISIFLGNDCMEIYKTWDMGISILIGSLTLLSGFLITFMFYLYQKKHNMKSSDSV